MIDNEWPSHHAELTRKTTELLEKWGNAYEAGVIPSSVWCVILSVLYDATSGLIDKDVSNLIAYLHQEASQP